MVSATIPLNDERRIMLLRSIKVIDRSENRKLSDDNSCSTTWASLDTCPECVWKNEGCYTQQHWAGLKTKEMNAASNGQFTPEEIAEVEADGILHLSGYYPLRLHSSGDCATRKAAQIVSSACDVFRARHNKCVWGYTHTRPLPPREDWGNVSMLASCETMEHMEAATEAGYACAITVKDFRSEKPYELKSEITPQKHEYIGIPCPNEVKGTKCVNCRLCWNDKFLRNSSDGKIRVVMFKLHGVQRFKMRDKVEF